MTLTGTSTSPASFAAAQAALAGDQLVPLAGAAHQQRVEDALVRDAGSQLMQLVQVEAARVPVARARVDGVYGNGALHHDATPFRAANRKCDTSPKRCVNSQRPKNGGPATSAVP